MKIAVLFAFPSKRKFPAEEFARGPVFSPKIPLLKFHRVIEFPFENNLIKMCDIWFIFFTDGVDFHAAQVFPSSDICVHR